MDPDPDEEPSVRWWDWFLVKLGLKSQHIEINPEEGRATRTNSRIEHEPTLFIRSLSAPHITRDGEDEIQFQPLPLQGPWDEMESIGSALKDFGVRSVQNPETRVPVVESRIQMEENPHPRVTIKSKSEVVLRPRHFETMMEILPVDDEEVAGFEMGEISMDWDVKSCKNRGVHGPSCDRDISALHDFFRPSRNRFFTPYAFIILCCFLLAWGIAGMVQSIVLIHVKTDSVEFLMLDRAFTTQPSHYLLLATGFSIFTAVLGLIGVFYDKPLLLILVPHLLWMDSVLALASGITAAGSIGVPTESTYTRLFEAVLLYSVDPSYLTETWPGLKPDIWDQIQKVMKCCGLHDSMDWLKTPHNPFIPLSCCAETCKDRIAQWMVGKTTFDQFKSSFSEIKPLLYADNCLHVISLERQHRVQDWTTYPTIFFVFHLLLMFNLNFNARLILKEYNSWDGRGRLAIFRSATFRIFKDTVIQAFCNRFSSIRKWFENNTDEEDFPATASAVTLATSPTNEGINSEASFVTTAGESEAFCRTENTEADIEAGPPFRTLHRASVQLHYVKTHREEEDSQPISDNLGNQPILVNPSEIVQHVTIKKTF